MDMISPHYRNDDASELDVELEQYLDSHYLRALPNKVRSNPKVLVVFSGGNAVGKSTISKMIGEQLGGLVLENDAIKQCILERTPDITRTELNTMTWQYTMHLYERLDTFTTNGLIVRDGVIDWYYDRILPLFEARGYRIFIIAFDLSRSMSERLIMRRGDTPTVRAERLYALIDDHEIHTQRFRSEYKSDIMLTDDTIYRHDLVVQALRDILSK